MKKPSEIKIVMGGYLNEDTRLISRQELNEWISSMKKYVAFLENKVKNMQECFDELHYVRNLDD